jgi:hypothetical protein
VVPAGMDPTRFEGAVNAATKTSLQSAGYSESDIDALRGWGLRELGDTLGTGRYQIINGNGDPLKPKGWKPGDPGKSIIIDLNQLKTAPPSWYKQPYEPETVPSYEPDAFTTPENEKVRWGK